MGTEDKIFEIMILCVKYHEMYMAERALRNCEDLLNYEILAKSYNIEKKIFDEQFSKVTDLIK